MLNSDGIMLVGETCWLRLLLYVERSCACKPFFVVSGAATLHLYVLTVMSSMLRIVFDVQIIVILAIQSQCLGMYRTTVETRQGSHALELKQFL